jgi:hypothetical protein
VITTQQLVEAPSGNRPWEGDAILSALPASVHVDAIELLQRELTVAYNMERTSLLTHVANTSRGEFVPAFTVFSESVTSAPPSLNTRLLRESITRLLHDLRRLTQQLPELGESESPPPPDPQPVDIEWLDSLSTISSRESTDLYRWYESMEEES